MRRVLSLILAIVMLFSLAACGTEDNHTGELQLPASSWEQTGKNYLDIVQVFEDAGFTNIKTEAIDDLVFGWLTKDGEIESISINGESSYSKGDWYPATSEIIITYHTFPSSSTAETEEQTNSAEQNNHSEGKNPSGETEKLPTETTENTVGADSTFNIHFIDVGQADAALIECDGHYMLIDGGNKADSNVIYSVLKKSSVPKLDIVVGTHAHEDHIGGLPGAFNYTTADVTLCPVKSYDSNAFEDFVRYANQNGGGITVPSVGDTYSLGSATIKILGVNGGSDANNTSIILRIDYGSTSFLFVGDAEREAEQAVLNSNSNLSATVLKVGHHGSDTSSSYVFLREVMPEYAVISVGTGNSYGHPTEDALSRLRDADAKVFRTDMQGDIYCTSDGKTVTFTVEKNAEADTLAGAGLGGNHNTESNEPENSQNGDEPVQATYVLNTSTKKFHYPTCSSVKQMAEKNKKEVTSTRDEIVGQGYSPCGRCHP